MRTFCERATAGSRSRCERALCATCRCSTPLMRSRQGVLHCVGCRLDVRREAAGADTVAAGHANVSLGIFSMHCMGRTLTCMRECEQIAPARAL